MTLWFRSFFFCLTVKHSWRDPKHDWYGCSADSCTDSHLLIVTCLLVLVLPTIKINQEIKRFFRKYELQFPLSKIFFELKKEVLLDFLGCMLQYLLQLQFLCAAMFGMLQYLVCCNVSVLQYLICSI